MRSEYLEREVRIDVYLPQGTAAGPDIGSAAAGPSMKDVTLLLINDGQELGNMGFAEILDELYSREEIAPLLCVGIHAGAERMSEYGTAGIPDFQGRGDRAAAYAQFVMEELIPAIRQQYQAPDLKEKAFAGFSMGALSAMDIVWRHPEEFTRAGLFSGSFWWRTKDKTDPEYAEHLDRIMERRVREGGYYPWLKFFFECGTEDELEDRNGNGIIDSIDDTQDLIRALVEKGYSQETDIRYLELEGGRHDIRTWARAMPEFLLWGWGDRI